MPDLAESGTSSGTYRSLKGPVPEPKSELAERPIAVEVTLRIEVKDLSALRKFIRQRATARFGDPEWSPTDIAHALKNVVAEFSNLEPHKFGCELHDCRAECSDKPLFVQCRCGQQVIAGYARQDGEVWVGYECGCQGRR